MTFAECLARCGELCPGSICLKVEAWRPSMPSRLEWSLWVADWGQHVRGPSPEALVIAVESYLSDAAAYQPKGPGSVVIGDMGPVPT
jgi:hypothetical protein